LRWSRTKSSSLWGLRRTTGLLWAPKGSSWRSWPTRAWSRRKVLPSGGRLVSTEFPISTLGKLFFSYLSFVLAIVSLLLLSFVTLLFPWTISP
jgi:hypothetical protein